MGPATFVNHERARSREGKCYRLYICGQKIQGETSGRGGKLKFQVCATRQGGVSRMIRDKCRIRGKIGETVFINSHSYLRYEKPTEVF